VDALEGFRAAARHAPRLFGTVDHHLSAAGHARLADLVAPYAASLLETPPTCKSLDQSRANELRDRPNPG
jgi:hypothetical protein